MWFLDNPSRVTRERSEIGKLFVDVNWLKKADWVIVDSQLCVNADIVINDKTYSVQMIYPSLFPLVPPSVKPLDTDRRWSSHQYGVGGELCLEWGPDTWQESVTGADLIRSTYKLLEIERPLEKEAVSLSLAPSRHALVLGQDVRSNRYRFIEQSSLTTYLNNQSEKASGIANCYFLLSRESYTVFVGGFETLDGIKWDNPLFPKELEKTTYHPTGHFFKLHLTTQVISSLSNMSELRGVLIAEGYDCPNIGENDSQFVIIIDQESELHLFQCWNKDYCYRFRTLNVPENDLATRVGDDLKDIGNTHVGIVGLGSAGSKIAESLARSGVRNFLLLDHDLFLPENICRHVLTWEDVGQHKVDGITHLLQLIDPNITINSRKLMLSGQEASSGVSSALVQLSKCDIIIDATAEPNIFNLLTAVAFQSNVSYIWLEIFPGGIGGLLCRFRPGHEPHPKKMKSALSSYLDTREPYKLKTSDDYTVETDNGKVVAATDADVSVIAAHATRMALDILSKREPSLFPYSIYLIGLSKEWIFEQPFFTIPVDLSSMKPDIPAAEIPSDVSEDHVKFIEGLLNQNQ